MGAQGLPWCAWPIGGGLRLRCGPGWCLKAPVTEGSGLGQRFGRDLKVVVRPWLGASSRSGEVSFFLFNGFFGAVVSRLFFMKRG